MRYESESGEPLEESAIDLNMGWVEERRDPVEHPAVEPVPEEGHWQDVMEDGQVIGQTWVVDVPAVEGSAAWTGYETVGVWHPYTDEELEANAAAQAEFNRTAAVAEQSRAAVMMLVAAQSASLSDSQAAGLDALFADWTVGTDYKTGDVVRYKSGLWRCLQPSTAQDIYPPDGYVAGWKRIGEPDASGVFPWSQPLGATDAYRKGDKVTLDGSTWVSIVEWNVWKPGEYGWEKSDGSTGDGGDGGHDSDDPEWPEFVQPTGAHDAYANGAKVTYEGRHYTSLIDGNVWSPADNPSGWQEV